MSNKNIITPQAALSQCGQDHAAWEALLLNEFLTKGEGKISSISSPAQFVFNAWSTPKNLDTTVEVLWNHPFWKERFRLRVLNDNRPLTKRRWFKRLSKEWQIQAATDLLHNHLDRKTKRKTMRFNTPARYECIIIAIEEIIPEAEREPWRARVRETLSAWENVIAKKPRLHPYWRRIFQAIPDKLAHSPSAAVLAKAL